MTSAATAPSLSTRLIRGSAWALVGRAAGVVGSLVANALLARALTPHELGVYFLTISIVVVAALLAQLGSSAFVTRFVAESVATERLGRARAAIRAAIVITFAGSLLAGGVFALLVTLVLAEHIFEANAIREIAILGGLLIPVYAFRQLIPEIFRGFHDIRSASVLGEGATSIALAAALAALLLVTGSVSVGDVLALAIVSASAVLVLSSAVLLRKTRDLGPRAKLRVREVASVTWPQFVTGVALTTSGQTGVFALGALRDPDDVALYGAAARLAIFLAVPLLIVNAVVAPLVAELYAGERRAKLEETLRATATVASTLTLLGFVTLLAAGRPLLGVVYGDYYRAAVAVLVILALGQVLNVLSGSCVTTLFMTGHQTTLMTISVVTAVATLAASFLFAHLYGAVGVAAVSAASVACQNGLTMLAARTKAGVWTAADFSFRSVRAIFGRTSG